MNSAGERVVEGVASRVLSRSATELRECGVPSLVGDVDVVMLLLLLLLLPVLRLKPVGEAVDLEGRVLPREVSWVVALVLAEDQRSFNVRGLAFFREGTRVVVGGGWVSSISISSPEGGGGERRVGEAEMSSAFRVDAGAGGAVWGV